MAGALDSYKCLNRLSTYRGKWVATICFFAKRVMQSGDSYSEVRQKTTHWKRKPIIFYIPTEKEEREKLF